MMSSVQLSNQLLVLLGVIIGALGSYLATAATERARWKRALDSRWDGRRVEAYASYGQAVKRMIMIASRIAAGRDLGSDTESLARPRRILTCWQPQKLSELAGGRRCCCSATPRPWRPPEAGMNMHGGWRHTRALITGEASAWRAARTATDAARAAFYDAARSDLRIEGGSLPLTEDPRDPRVQRIRGEPSS
jgi:hypothetical protein